MIRMHRLRDYLWKLFTSGEERPCVKCRFYRQDSNTYSPLSHCGAVFNRTFDYVLGAVHCTTQEARRMRDGTARCSPKGWLWQPKPSEAERATDLLFSAIKHGKTSMRDMAANIKWPRK